MIEAGKQGSRLCQAFCENHLYHTLGCRAR